MEGRDRRYQIIGVAAAVEAVVGDARYRSGRGSVTVEVHVGDGRHHRPAARHRRDHADLYAPRQIRQRRDVQEVTRAYRTVTLEVVVQVRDAIDASPVRERVGGREQVALGQALVELD